MRLISVDIAGAALSMGAALAHHLGAALPPGMLALVRSTWARLSHRATRCGHHGPDHRLHLVRLTLTAARAIPLILTAAIISGCAATNQHRPPGAAPPAWCSSAATADPLILRQSPTTPGETAARSGWLLLPGLTTPDPWALISISRGSAPLALPADTRRHPPQRHTAAPAAARPAR